MPNQLREWAESTGAVLAWLAGIGGSLFAVIKWGRRATQCIVMVDRLTSVLGVDGVEALIDRIKALEMEAEEGRIRRAIYEQHLDIGVWVCDADGFCVFANEWICELWGIDSSEITGYGWLGGIHPGDRNRAYAEWQAAVKQGTPYESEYRIVNQRTQVETTIRTEGRELKRDSEIIAYIGSVTRDNEPLEG